VCGKELPRRKGIAMGVPEKDLRIEPFCGGRHAGGQHMNKKATGCRITHLPTGIVVRQVGRSYDSNLKKALKELDRRLAEAKQQKQSDERKARRDHAIKNEVTIRTYDFQTGLAHDHRTGKKATLKQVLEKGRFELIAPTQQERY
jgi:peptide chain release factor 1